MIIIINQGREKKAWPELMDIAANSKEHVLKIVDNAETFIHFPEADAFIDLDFREVFFSPNHKPCLINETIKTFDELPDAPIYSGRFCDWAGFCERDIWEIATAHNETGWLSPLLAAIGKNYEIVGDKPGLVAPRIISMIINEAYYAIGEGISTAPAIDKAMKLGTSYPEGPITWANKIGKHQVYDLLIRLLNNSGRYSPHPLLKQID